MENWVERIGKMNENYLRYGFLILFVLNFLRGAWFLDLGIAFVLLILVAIRFVYTRKWLKEVDTYVRMNKPIPFWSTAIWVVVCIILGVCYAKWGDNFSFELHAFTALMLTICGWILSIDRYYSAFIDSLKSEHDGLYLPNRNRQQIMWRDVYQFELGSDNRLLLSSNLGEITFEIDARDRDDARKLIYNWEKHKVKTNHVR